MIWPVFGGAAVDGLSALPTVDVLSILSTGGRLSALPTVAGLSAPPTTQPASGSGQGPEWGAAAPIGLLIILLMGGALFLLIKSMNRNLRRVPESFDPASSTSAGVTDSAGDEAGDTAEDDEIGDSGSALAGPDGDPEDDAGEDEGPDDDDGAGPAGPGTGEVHPPSSAARLSAPGESESDDSDDDSDVAGSIQRGRSQRS